MAHVIAVRTDGHRRPWPRPACDPVTGPDSHRDDATAGRCPPYLILGAACRRLGRPGGL